MYMYFNDLENYLKYNYPTIIGSVFSHPCYLYSKWRNGNPANAESQP